MKTFKGIEAVNHISLLMDAKDVRAFQGEIEKYKSDNIGFKDFDIRDYSVIRSCNKKVVVEFYLCDEPFKSVHSFGIHHCIYTNYSAFAEEDEVKEFNINEIHNFFEKILEIASKFLLLSDEDYF